MPDHNPWTDFVKILIGKLSRTTKMNVLIISRLNGLTFIENTGSQLVQIYELLCVYRYVSGSVYRYMSGSVYGYMSSSVY